MDPAFTFRSPPVSVREWSQLALPALHASHAGTWLRDAARRHARRFEGRGDHGRGGHARCCCSTPRWSPAGWAIPTCRASTCSSCSPSSTRRASSCRRPRASPMRSALDEPASDDDVPALLQQAAAALLARLRAPTTGPSAKARGRRCNRSPSCAGRGRSVLAPHVAPARARPRSGCSRACPNGRRRPNGRSPRKWRSTNSRSRRGCERLTGEGAERREGQRRYAREAGRVFAPRDRAQAPHMLLAQAGTGIGKTLGYLAPASLWAEKSQGTVWVSTLHQEPAAPAAPRKRPRLAARARPTAASRWWCARGARTTCACSTSRTRCKAASAAARRCSRSSSRAGPPIRRTAT